MTTHLSKRGWEYLALIWSQDSSAISFFGMDKRVLRGLVAQGLIRRVGDWYVDTERGFFALRDEGIIWETSDREVEKHWDEVERLNRKALTELEIDYDEWLTWGN